jgi:hypothetical protein
LALRDHGAERTLEPFEFIDLLPNVGDVLFSDTLHLRACHSPGPSELKKRAHIVDGETQISRVERRLSASIFFGIESVSAKCPSQR